MNMKLRHIVRFIVKVFIDPMPISNWSINKMLTRRLMRGTWNGQYDWWASPSALLITCHVRTLVASPLVKGFLDSRIVFFSSRFFIWSQHEKWLISRLNDPIMNNLIRWIWRHDAMTRFTTSHHYRIVSEELKRCCAWGPETKRAISTIGNEI